MAGSGPGVRRLCAALSAARPDLLATACRSGRLDRMYVVEDHASGLELALAPPGVDEIRLVRDLVGALRGVLAAGRVAVGGDEECEAGPVLLALHVGIVQVVGDGFGGAGVRRIRTLIEERALLPDRTAPGIGRAPLVVAVSGGLFADLRAEGLPDRGWSAVTPADAWVRPFGAARDGPGRDPDRDHDGFDQELDQALDQHIDQKWF